MKKIKAEKNFILIWIIIIIMIMGVSYAYFSSTLYIYGIATLDGTFDIKFSEASIVNQTELETINISDNGLELSFNVKLALPGESDTIEYTIKNNGTIDAVLDELVVTSATDTDVTFNCSSIAGDLPSGETKGGTIVVTWNADSVSPQKDVSFNAEIIANQKVN
ncbi:MAG: hypothetical protein MR598_07915 [Erysipelotrichaceae bacterium]|nr:hypothetical protein [Erysipelotrichaceae bacterium]